MDCIIRLPVVIALLLVVVFTMPGRAQTLGPDVIVGALHNRSNWGSSGNIAAFSIGTTSCNIGTSNLQWISSTNQHPVIGQNMYKLVNDRFTQIGQSWLKHGFFALDQNLCGVCNPTGGTTLGVGCSDPYGSGLNGSQGGLGMRSEVNASTGVYLYPPSQLVGAAAVIGRRLQVHHNDLDPALNPGALYFVDGHYVTPDDAAAGNDDNNASYRTCTVSPSGGSYDVNLTGTTQQQQQAIIAWQDVDPTVVLDHVDVPGDGRFTAGHKIIALGGGMFRHEFAVQNLNSHRSCMAVTATVSPGATIQNAGFHDVDYHSGEPFSGTDWTWTTSSEGITWTTEDYFTNQNANALRWGTLYNFWFETDGTVGGLNLTMFRPGTPTTVTAFCPDTPVVGSLINYSMDPAPAYDYVDISGVAQQGPTTTGSVTAPVGFTFPFYETTLTQIQIGVSGYLSVPGTLGNSFSNTQLPSPIAPNGIIAGYWDDLSLLVSGQVTYATLGSAPNRRLVVDYDSMSHLFIPSQSESLQISLYEGGDITMTWVATTQGGSGATIGIESPAGDEGVQLSYNAVGTVVAGTSVRFIRSNIIPPSMGLTLQGNGTAGTTLTLAAVAPAFSPISIFADTSPGPIPLGANGSLGILHLGFSPTFFPIVDGVGIFQAPSAMGMTDECGVWTLTVPLTVGLPSGLVLHMQGLAPNIEAPNGLFDLSTPVTLIVP